MKLLDRLEPRFRHLAVHNLTLIIIACQVAAFLLQLGRPELIEQMLLRPERVLAGEWWRVLTFVAIPPLTNPIFAFFAWYLFYLMGTALEANWGAFRYNVFLLIGYVASVGAAFFTPAADATNGLLMGSVFLAFAYLYPNFEILLMFLLPVKIKWLALFTWIVYFFTFATGDLTMKLMVAAAVLNFFVFFGSDIVQRIYYGRRRMAYQARQIAAQSRVRHRCVVCGITDKSHPQMDFRYCSKCDGPHAYCTEHLRDHEHIVKDPKAQQR
jgi:hypothetical protein